MDGRFHAHAFTVQLLQICQLPLQGPTLPAGYPQIRMYNVTVNHGIEMSTNRTTLSIPNSIFSGAGIYSFDVRAVNILGAAASIMANFEGAVHFQLVKCCCIIIIVATCSYSHKCIKFLYSYNNKRYSIILCQQHRLC